MSYDSRIVLLHARAILLLLSIVYQVLLILKVNLRKVGALYYLGLVVRAVGLRMLVQNLRAVELVHTEAQIMIKLILRDLVRAIAAVLGYHHVLLVLLLEELLVDLGNVLRDNLGVRMRVHDGWSDLLEIILRSRQIAKVVLLSLS